jgi:hypothetical protein
MRRIPIAALGLSVALVGLGACEGGGTQEETRAAQPSKASSAAPTPTKTTPTVTHEVVRNRQDIPYRTKTERTPGMEKGTTKVSQAGRTGVRVKTYRVTRRDGNEVSRELVKTAVVRHPRAKVVLVGTRPPLTVAQQNAIQSAEDYLDFQAFSRLGLIDQLSSKYGEGFSKADATFAVDHVKVNWNEQAALSAKQYLKTGSFSHNGLVDQLSSRHGERFTRAQAEYGVSQTGL